MGTSRECKGTEEGKLKQTVRRKKKVQHLIIVRNVFAAGEKKPKVPTTCHRGRSVLFHRKEFIP